MTPEQKERRRAYQKTYHKTWREKNSEKERARRKAEYANDREKELARQKTYREANPEKIRAQSRVYQREKWSGWTQDEFEAAWEKQGGRCAICGRPMEKTGNGKYSVVADHDHRIHQKRALLHRNCNIGLGYFEDSPYALRAAAHFVELHQDKFAEDCGGITRYFLSPEECI